MAPVQQSLRKRARLSAPGSALELSLLRQEDRTSKLFASMLCVGQLTGDVPRLATWLADPLENQARASTWKGSSPGSSRSSCWRSNDGG